MVGMIVVGEVSNNNNNNNIHIPFTNESCQRFAVVESGLQFTVMVVENRRLDAQHPRSLLHFGKPVHSQLFF